MNSVDDIYCNVLRDILENGKLKENRTGIDTLSLFGVSYKIDLSQGYPLLTTKKVNFNAMLYETLWYISGEQHIRNLQKHTKIWDAWATEQGELETAYGRYWREFPLISTEDTYPEETVHLFDDLLQYRNSAIDQLAYAINELQINPNSRRIVITAWHPDNALVSKLPPCHLMWILNVQGDRLNLHMTQRSADVPVGVPFNIASYSLMCMLLAQHVGLKPGYFHHTLVDAHIYVNQIEQIKEQLNRESYDLPTLEIDKQDTIDDYRFEHFHLKNYKHHPFIKMPVAV